MSPLFKAGSIPAASALLVMALGLSAGAAAQTTFAPVHAHGASAGANLRAPPPFVATTAKPFAGLVDDAMNVMNDGMGRAPMNGSPDHDFAAMMIPHHQGAVDMAKAVLLYGKNPVLRRLAQEIIVSQGAEIAVMQAEIDKSMGAAAQPTRP